MPIPLSVSYRGSPEVSHRVGRPPELNIPVNIHLPVEGHEQLDFSIFQMGYHIELWEVSNYDAIPDSDNKRLDIGSFPQRGILTTKRPEDHEESGEDEETVGLTVPLYPEIIEEMNRISSENKFVSFLINIHGGYVLWSDKEDRNVGGIDVIESTEVTENVRGEDLSPIRLRNEELTQIFSNLEQMTFEWLSVPIPVHETDDLPEPVSGYVTSAVDNLQSARNVIHTPSYGQAMIDIRNARGAIAVHEERGGTEQWYLKEEVRDALRERRGNTERKAIRDMTGALGQFASKYVHADRPELTETPPWEETKFVYSQFSHLIWYLSKVLAQDSLSE